MWGGRWERREKDGNNKMQCEREKELISNIFLSCGDGLDFVLMKMHIPAERGTLGSGESLLSPNSTGYCYYELGWVYLSNRFKIRRWYDGGV